MTKGRKTTQQERAEIVAFCLEHGKDYPQTIEKYGVSYQQIYSWVRKYEEKGVDGLIDDCKSYCCAEFNICTPFVNADATARTKCVSISVILAGRVVPLKIKSHHLTSLNDGSVGV